MCYRGSQTGADGREFAGFDHVDGGVRGIFSSFQPGRLAGLLAVVEGPRLRYTDGVNFFSTGGVAA